MSAKKMIWTLSALGLMLLCGRAHAIPLEIQGGFGYHQDSLVVRASAQEPLWQCASMTGFCHISAMKFECEKMSLKINAFVRNFGLMSFLIIGTAQAFASSSAFQYAPAFAFQQSVPSKIFTPNGDGYYDTFRLTFNNPNGSIISQKKVFDLTGAEVADLQVVGDETLSPVTLFWNGKDTNGSVVRGGIYIYQVQADGKIFNGMVVVAK